MGFDQTVVGSHERQVVDDGGGDEETVRGILVRQRQPDALERYLVIQRSLPRDRVPRVEGGAGTIRYNTFVANRADDWFRQAKADVEHAELSASEGDFEWSCFAAQQAAEKALKALYYSQHGDPWGHSLLALMQALPSTLSVTTELLDSARSLDRHYIQARYPNGFAAGAPIDYFTERDAREAIGHAKSILEYCRAQIRRP